MDYILPEEQLIEHAKTYLKRALRKRTSDGRKTSENLPFAFIFKAVVTQNKIIISDLVFLLIHYCQQNWLMVIG